MKYNRIRKTLSFVLACAMVVCLSASAGVTAKVNAEEKPGDKAKYVGDVFIAYGKTEDEAKKWLTKNGWEPVDGDFNAGKASYWDNSDFHDENVAAVMGISRTDNKNEAITDMAVMNMKGGYSLPAYEDLVNQKKAEINEFINQFMVVIKEFRQNCAGRGTEFGQKRASLARSILDKFYDGDPNDASALHDTGDTLGSLFLDKTMQEENKNGLDLEQLMLESSGPAMLAVETFLALGADAGQETWLERAGSLTGDQLSENLPKYVPEAAGQDVPPSAVSTYLYQHYGDTAVALSEQWDDIHDTMLWYEHYNDEHGLWQEDGEDDQDYTSRIEEYFADLKKTAEDKDAAEAEQSKHANARIIYSNLYEVGYEGEWGETLGDFFNPADGTDYSLDADNFLPLAAGLSPGQKAAIDFLSLNMLLLIGFGNEEAFDAALPDITELFGDKTEISIYAGVNREAFRGGVAITNEALMEEHAGRGSAYNQIWDHTGYVAISSYIAAAISVPMIIAGAVMKAKGFNYAGFCAEDIKTLKNGLKVANDNITKYTRIVNRAKVNPFTGELSPGARQAKVLLSVNENDKKLAEAELARANNSKVPTKMGVAGRWMLGIGGAILVGAAVVKGVQMYKYYQRKMTPIPLMIVDESDIVTYLTDQDGNPILDDRGNQKKNIDFNTYEYYAAVKCNRPEVGEIGDWQDGVKEYKTAGCYDVADLNADMGQEWLALYTAYSKNKGNPILADSLKVQYGSSSMPKGCTKGLHLFTYTNALDLGDTAWAFNNKKKGVYFFWDEDANAFQTEETASAFSGGHLALAGLGGLIVGIAAAVLVQRPHRKKEENEA